MGNEQRIAGERQLFTDTVVRGGYWTIYQTGRHYGGPEEGGWWYDSGVMVACVQGSREYLLSACKVWDPDYGWEVDEDTVSYRLLNPKEEPPQVVNDMMRYMEEQGYGVFTRAKRTQTQLKLVWTLEMTPEYPTARPRYE